MCKKIVIAAICSRNSVISVISIAILIFTIAVIGIGTGFEIGIVSVGIVLMLLLLYSENSQSWTRVQVHVDQPLWWLHGYNIPAQDCTCNWSSCVVCLHPSHPICSRIRCDDTHTLGMASNNIHTLEFPGLFYLNDTQKISTLGPPYIAQRHAYHTLIL